MGSAHLSLSANAKKSPNSASVFTHMYIFIARERESEEKQHHLAIWLAAVGAQAYILTRRHVWYFGMALSWSVPAVELSMCWFKGLEPQHTTHVRKEAAELREVPYARTVGLDVSHVVIRISALAHV